LYQIVANEGLGALYFVFFALCTSTLYGISVLGTGAELGELNRQKATQALAKNKIPPKF